MLTPSFIVEIGPSPSHPLPPPPLPPPPPSPAPPSPLLSPSPEPPPPPALPPPRPITPQQSPPLHSPPRSPAIPLPSEPPRVPPPSSSHLLPMRPPSAVSRPLAPPSATRTHTPSAPAPPSEPSLPVPLASVELAPQGYATGGLSMPPPRDPPVAVTVIPRPATFVHVPKSGPTALPNKAPFPTISLGAATSASLVALSSGVAFLLCVARFSSLLQRHRGTKARGPQRQWPQSMRPRLKVQTMVRLPRKSKSATAANHNWTAPVKYRATRLDEDKDINFDDENAFYHARLNGAVALEQST